jgi:rifampicin phosphotransferase
MIVPRGELLSHLQAICRDPITVHIVAIRDFTAGRLGLITRPAGKDEILAEYSPDGLLALNRGTAQAKVAIIGPGGEGHPPELLKEAAETLRRVTLGAQPRFGPVQAEWVEDGGQLLLLDYSPLSDDLQLAAHNGLGHVSAGFARGPVLRVEDSGTLVALSEGPSISISKVPPPQSLGGFSDGLLAQIRAMPQPPIIVCRRPYAILAVLIPYVSGFVFESASILSHLAILIRESGKPSLASAALFAKLRDGDWLTLNASVNARHALANSAVEGREA